MLIKYELKKLVGTKYIIIIFSVLILLNVIVCGITAASSASDIPDQYIDSLFEEYNKSPESVNEAYEKIKEQYNEQMMLIAKAFAEGKTEVELNLSRSYINYKDFTDYDLFSSFYSYIEYPLRFKDKLQNIIDTAKSNANEYKKLSDEYDSFSYNYQLQIIDKYSNVLQNINIPTVYPKGWDAYLQYESINIFIMLFAVILASNMFIQENAYGFHPILRITPNGRLKTGIAKVIASNIIIIISVAAFVLSSLATIYFVTGFSDPFLPVQIFENINLCPYLYSALDCVLINLIYKIISALLILNIVMLISLSYRYVITIISGIVILAANFMVFILPSSNAYKYINIFSAASAKDVFLRYRAVPLFDNSVDILLFINILYAALFICTALIVMTVGCKPLPNIKRIQNDKSRLLFKLVAQKKYKNSTYSNIKPSLVLFELQKKKILLVVAVLITFAKLIYNKYLNIPIISSNELVYKEYLTAFEGEYTPEKIDYIKKEAAYISDILLQEIEYRTRYDLGELSYEEYTAYLKEYYYCQARANAIDRLYRHALYLENIQNTAGIKTYFIYDTGIVEFATRGFDPFLILVIILLGANNFIPEYIKTSSKEAVHAILRTTKHGRNRLYYVKIFTTVILSAFFYLIYQIIDWLFVRAAYYIPDIPASLISIEIYQKTPVSFTISQYLIFIFICGLIGVCIISLFCSVLSQLLKKALYIYSTSIITLLAPQAVTGIGISELSLFNPLLIIMPDKLYRMAIDANISQPLLLYFAVFFTPLIIVGLITRVSYKDYCL